MHDLEKHLTYLKLSYIKENYASIAVAAARKEWTHTHFLSELIKQESGLRRDRMIQRRIRMAKFPVIKTLEQFNWSWPKKINRVQIENLFHLKFIEKKSNV
ncbi:MAG: ATP-binding protein, partial [Desulfobacula sp.]|nr:ATP-binding protein [Desulfobacula sp.]